MTKQTIFHLYLAAFVLGICSVAQAQVSVGVRAGFLLNNYEKSPLEQNEVAPEAIGAYQLAIPIEIGLGSVLAIQPEIMFGSHGGQQQDQNTSTQLGITNSVSYKITYRIQSLEIPLLAKAKFGSENVKFHILAGPSFGFGVAGTVKQHSTLRSEAGGVVLIDQTNDDELKAKFLKEGYAESELGENEFAVAKTNLNVHAGLGFSFDLGGPVVVFDARYIAGISDLAPKAANENTDYVYKSRRLGFSLGVMFPL